MRKIAAILVGIVLVITAIDGYTYVQNAEKNIPAPSPTPYPSTSITSPTSSPISTCTQQDLEAKLMTEGAAGSIYITFTIKNISDKSCTVLGHDFITANFNKSVTNLTVSHTGVAMKSPFTLSAGQTIYSQLKYPNGPQCSTATRTTPVTFTYAISPSETIAFTNHLGSKTELIPVCQKESEITTMQFWNMSEHPIVY